MPHLFSSLTRPARWLVAFGAATAGTALFHVGVWLVAGMPSLTGPVTWRKPIVFGASIAVLSWSLAWVLRHLPDDRGIRRQTAALMALPGPAIFLMHRRPNPGQWPRAFRRGRDSCRDAHTAG